MVDNIMVSVAMITYMHEKYIRHALDSVLMQKVNFLYEIVIGDDASSDGTVEILKEYAKSFPDKFKLILREKNVGMNNNAYDVYINCTGRYIAELEGDDYWLDENKLQKQVDFLEKNSDFSCVAHSCSMVNEKEETLMEVYSSFCTEKLYSLKMYEAYKLPGQTATLMYRNIFLNNEEAYSYYTSYPETPGDRIMALILLSLCNVYCMPEVMSAYRYVTNKGSISWSADNLRNNRCYDEYISLCDLEDIACKHLDLKISLKTRKVTAYALSWLRIIKEPRVDNFKIMKNILFSYDHKFKMIFFGGIRLLRIIRREIIDKARERRRL